jgi:hypothetical protein
MESCCIGWKTFPSLCQSKLFIELLKSLYFDSRMVGEAVNKLNEKKIDSIENVDDNYDLPWSVEQETGKFDQRSSDDESQVAIDMKMTEICIEKCD